MEGLKSHTMTSRITSDMVKPFNGKGDIKGWITKVELVCKLTNIQEEAKVIPLYLWWGFRDIYADERRG